MERFQTKFWNQGISKESRTGGSSVEGWQCTWKVRSAHGREEELLKEVRRARLNMVEMKNVREFRPEGS